MSTIDSIQTGPVLHAHGLGTTHATVTADAAPAASIPIAPSVGRAVTGLAVSSWMWLLLAVAGGVLLEVKAGLPLPVRGLLALTITVTTTSAVMRTLLARRAGRAAEPSREARQGDAETTQDADREATAPTPATTDLVITCSGGGIKSASFSLGALQRLDEMGLYDKASHLIGVSGGGYAATAFSLAPREPDASGQRRVFGMQSDALRELRQRTNYLADSRRTGYEFLLSLTFGISVNLIAALAALFLWVRVVAAWLIAAGHVTTAGSPQWRLDVVPDWQHLLAPLGVPAVLALLTFLAFLYDRLEWPHETVWSNRAPRGFWSELPPRLVTLAWVWLLAFPVLVLVASHVGQGDLAGFLTPTDVPGWVKWLVTSGLLVSAVKAVRSGMTATRGNGFWGALATQLRRTVIPRMLILLAAFGAYLAVAASLSWVLSSPRDGWVHGNLSLVVAGAIVLLFRFGGSANLTSMYPFYRDRLAWAFLYQKCGDQTQQAQGRCRHGNLARTCPERVPASTLTFDSLDRDRPRLVLCATANVNHDPTPSGRNAAAFINSRDRTGLSDEQRYPGALHSLESLRDSARRHPIGAALSRATGRRERAGRSVKNLYYLGSAMAISGAAVAPLAGRDSRQVGPFRLLLTLANIRLGVWQRNPEWIMAERATAVPTWLWRANQVFNQATPAHVLAEATGRLRLSDPNLYLTDGGHYDNLGLVEALRQRPRRIIVLDGSGDPQDQFPTMGRAIATARMDLGVEIAFDPAPLLTSAGRRQPETVVVRATATWPGEARTCQIDYVRAVLPNRASWDVRAYAAARDTFPDSSDTMEVYGEFDFEAFRQLGYLAAGFVPAESRVASSTAAVATGEPLAGE